MSRKMLCTLALACLTATTGCNAADAKAPATGSGGKKAAAAQKDTTPSRITSSVDVSPSTKKLTTEEQRHVSFAAGRILKHVAQARDAIKAKKTDDAKAHVDKGLTLVGIINSVLPHYTVKTEIKSGDLVYSDDDDVTPHWVTVFDELEHRDVIGPLASAKQEAAAKDAAATKDAGKSGSDKAATETPLVVSHADIDYSALRLNVRLADSVLHQAKKNLDAGRTELADADLLVLQTTGVVFEYDEIDLPLEEAADNLKLAEAEMKAGRYEAAKAALHLAIDELKTYEKTVGETHAKEVKALHQEIDKLTKELATGKPTAEAQKKHTSTISGWWDKVTGWFKKK